MRGAGAAGKSVLSELPRWKNIQPESTTHRNLDLMLESNQFLVSRDPDWGTRIRMPPNFHIVGELVMSLACLVLFGVTASVDFQCGKHANPGHDLAYQTLNL